MNEPNWNAQTSLSRFGTQFARILLALGLLWCAYSILARTLAMWLAREGTPDGYRAAMHVEPMSGRYPLLLARSLQFSPTLAEHGEITRLYERAAALEPHRARTWAELGGAYEWAGRTNDAQRAYRRALELFPRSPQINWQYGNFCLRIGREQAGLSALRTAVEGDPALRKPAFQLAWSSQVRPEEILARMIPPEPDILIEYLSYLTENERVDEAGATWQRLLAAEGPFEPAHTFFFFDALIRARRIDALSNAWNQLCARFPGRLPARRRENLLLNAEFETPPGNGGLDWRVTPVDGVQVSISPAAADHGRALSIEFDGRHNVDYAHVFQYVPLASPGNYRFTGCLRAQSITTNSAPRLELLDAYDSRQLFLFTTGAAGDSPGSCHTLEFRIGSAPRLVIVRVARPASRKLDSRIAGRVWVDGLWLERITPGGPRRDP